MGELVGKEVLLSTGGEIPAVSVGEEDISTHGEGLGTDGLRGVGRRAIGMEADGSQIVAKGVLHLLPQVMIERSARTFLLSELHHCLVDEVGGVMPSGGLGFQHSLYVGIPSVLLQGGYSVNVRGSAGVAV